MTKRLLLLDDDELERLLRWRASDELWTGETSGEDDELAEKIAAARLES